MPINIKRNFLIFISMTFLFCVAGGSVQASKNQLKVLTTTSDLKSITEFIGGDKVKVSSISTGSANIHFMQTKPSYMIKARKADLFIKNGLGLEVTWVGLIIEGSRNAKIKPGNRGHLDASKGISPLDIPSQKIDRSMGDIHLFGNPHYWLDPLNAKIMAFNIAERLTKLSPENSDYFQENLVRFNAKIDTKMKEWKVKLAPYHGEPIVTYHKSWSYFVKRFGFKVAVELEPKPGILPSPSHLKEVIDIIKQDNVKVILNEIFYSEKAAKFVAGTTGASVVIVPNSVGGTEEAKNYFNLIDTIVERIVQGFKNAEGRQ